MNKELHGFERRVWRGRRLRLFIAPVGGCNLCANARRCEAWVVDVDGGRVVMGGEGRAEVPDSVDLTPWTDTEHVE